MGCAQVRSKPGRGSFVTTLSANEGNGCPAVHQDAQVVIEWTHLLCFL